MSVIDTADACVAFIQSRHLPKNKNALSQRAEPPPTANAHSMFFPSGDFPQLRCIIWLYCSGVGACQSLRFSALVCAVFPQSMHKKVTAAKLPQSPKQCLILQQRIVQFFVDFSRTPSTSNPLSYRALPSPSKHPVRHRIPVPHRKWY